MSIRRKARELALQCLYQSELSGRPFAEAFPLFRDHFEISKKALPYAEKLVLGVAREQAAIDRLIQEHAANWRLSRMAVIDRNLLRLATLEIRFMADVPANVAINEALEITRRYSTEESAAFINGVLDSIRKSMPEEGKSGKSEAEHETT